ncbi:hypothetical protein LXL04_025487 [Taraxacum kok-saghyz]
MASLMRINTASIPIPSIPDRDLKRIDSISILPPTLGIPTSALCHASFEATSELASLTNINAESSYKEMVKCIVANWQ